MLEDEASVVLTHKIKIMLPSKRSRHIGNICLDLSSVYFMQENMQYAGKVLEVSVCVQRNDHIHVNICNQCNDVMRARDKNTSFFLLLITPLLPPTRFL